VGAAPEPVRLPPQARRALVGRLQESAASAVPASHEHVRGRCRLRVTDSSATWWAGGSLLHGDDAERDVRAAVDAAERFAAAHDEAALVQVCPACPPSLDDELDVRGYSWAEVVSLQVADSRPVADRQAPAGLRIQTHAAPDDSWCDLALAGPRLRAERVMLARVPGPSAYVTVEQQGEPVAVGRAVADDGWAGIFSMVTAPAARRRGGGSAVLATLAGWALDRGCDRLYLQVEQTNEAARGLYAAVGFTELSRYHYRRAPTRRPGVDRSEAST
jgi:GNAT superfamily N-acetyltransferase